MSCLPEDAGHGAAFHGKVADVYGTHAEHPSTRIFTESVSVVILTGRGPPGARVVLVRCHCFPAAINPGVSIVISVVLQVR